MRDHFSLLSKCLTAICSKNPSGYLLLLVIVLVSAPAYSQHNWDVAAKKLVAQMTLEEKAAMCSGRDYWSTVSVPRLGIPALTFADGPHGLRKAAGADFTQSLPATCFPTASALASSWNETLLLKMGEALGQQCRANNVQVLLGPGVNMKRSPLGGRNFEYFSEDPVLAGNMAAALINGIQSQGVGTSLKHFAANNQEFERNINNSVIDQQTLREIYLPAFEIAVKMAAPWTIMCAYNKLNGTLASENRFLLDSILRQDWNYKGFVMSDWGAVNNRIAGLDAGLNLEMPGNNGYHTNSIIAAVKSGALDIKRLDEMVAGIVSIALQSKEQYKPIHTYDREKHHQLAREISAESIVLLKNDDHLLPLDPARHKKIAIIGDFAKTPRYQGSGSSQIVPDKLSNAYDELVSTIGKKSMLSFAAGYNKESLTSDSLIAEAQEQARNSNIAIIFAGLPDSYESEGFDRTNIDIPSAYTALIEAVLKVQPNIVVVLMNGSAIAMPWAAKATSILECWLGGQGGGAALADVLTGKVNPSGKLSETFPVRLEDTPAFTDFPGRSGTSWYGEKIFTGYRFYDKKQIAPLFAFGHGLSYTSFVYTGMKVNVTEAKDTAAIIVEVSVKNTGKLAGKEVVQLYLHDNNKNVLRPEKELKHFKKIELLPGEEDTVVFRLNYRDLAYYDESVQDWQTSNGIYTILAGGSSDQLPLKKDMLISATRNRHAPLTRNSMMKEISMRPGGKAVTKQLLAYLGSGRDKTVVLTPAQQAIKDKAAIMLEHMLQDLPVYKLLAASSGRLTEAAMTELLEKLNAP